MSAKPTSLAAAVARQAEATKKAEAVEDAAKAQEPTSNGDVWVRLIRPFYNSEGRYFDAGVHLLPADAVPSSAKVLTAKEAAKADEGTEVEED